MLLGAFWSCLSLLSAQSTDGDALFDVPGIHDVHITFTQPSFWDSLLTYKPLDKPMLGAVDIDGTAMDSVGVQLKGNSSYNSYPGVKKSMKISFDEYVGQKFDGLKTLNLHNGFKDPTMMREKIMLDFCNRNGIAAPRCTYARVFLNGTYWGLYTMVEQVNKTFLTDRFGNNDGNLYKGDPNGTLQWLGSLPSSYTSNYELKTNETTNDWRDLVHLIDIINNTPVGQFHDSLERVLDTETFIGVWASNNLYSNLDSYLGSGHNYYIYHDTIDGLFKFISWDVNEAFGNFQMGLGWPGIQTMSYFAIPGNPSSRPLTNEMRNNALYLDAYVDRLCSLATYDFTTAHLYPIIDSLANLIRTDVYADLNKMYSNQQFEDNIDTPINGGPMGQIPGLKDFIIGRRNALQTQLSSFGCTMVVGSEDGSGSPAVKVWPNPSSGEFKMEFPVAEGQLTVTNMMGQVVLQREVTDYKEEFRMQLPSGLYCFTLTRAVGEVLKGKLIFE